MKTRKIVERTNKSTEDATIAEQIGTTIGENPALFAASVISGFAVAAAKETGIIGTIAGIAGIFGAAYCFDKAVQGGYIKHHGDQTIRKHGRKILIEKLGAVPFTKE